MRALIQRVTNANVTIDGTIKSAIDAGLLVFVGIEDDDNREDIIWLSNKIVNLRIFDDENNVPNISIRDIDGEILVVSQFTLHASTKKGNRPSYLKASISAVAVPLYVSFVRELGKDLGKEISTGEFGSDMKIALINDGPVTIWIDSKQRE